MLFLREAIAQDTAADEWTGKDDLYNAYIRFSSKYNIAIKSIEAFGKDLKRLRPDLNEGKRGKQDEKRKICRLGIRLTPEYQLDTGKQQQLTLGWQLCQGCHR